MEKQIKRLKRIIETQGNEGNWNYDNYNHGMFNGLELALSILEDRDPVYKEAPGSFISDFKEKPIEALTVEHFEIMEGIKEGATIWGYYEAKLLREVQAYDEELLTIVGLEELERIENKVYDGAGKLPYFGAILTAHGKQILEGGTK